MLTKAFIRSIALSIIYKRRDWAVYMLLKWIFSTSEISHFPLSCWGYTWIFGTTWSRIEYFPQKRLARVGTDSRLRREYGLGSWSLGWFCVGITPMYEYIVVQSMVPDYLHIHTCTLYTPRAGHIRSLTTISILSDYTPHCQALWNSMPDTVTRARIRWQTTK